MGRQVNVVLPSGRVVSVDEDTAQQGLLPYNNAATVTPVAAEETSRLNEERSSGVLEGAQAAGEGLLDTASFGGYGALASELSPEYGRNMAIRGQERPGSRFAGEVGAYLIPGLGEANLATRGGEIAAELGGKYLGRATTGALAGLGGYVASTNITGDPLTIEGAVESAGVGAILDLGFSALADRLEGAVWNIKKARAEADFLKKGADFFEDPPPSWNEFVTSHEAAIKSAQTVNKEITREAADYADFVGNNAKLTKAIDETQGVVNYVRNERYAGQVVPKLEEAGGARGPSTPMPRSGEFRFREVAGEHAAPVGLKPPTTPELPQGIGAADHAAPVELSPTGEFSSSVRATAPDIHAPPEMIQAPGTPISRDMLDRLRAYDRRISRVYKLKSGGFRIDNTGNWVKDPAIGPNPQGALEELRGIQRDLMGDFSKASGRMKTQLPPPPRTPIPVPEVEIPKSLGDFARKHADQIQKLGQSLDPTSQSALLRVMKDLDLQAKGSAAENVASVHETLRNYRSAVEGYKARVAGAAAKEAQRPLLLRLLNRGVRYAVAGKFSIGGILGTVTRGAAGEAAGGTLARIEDSVLGGALFQARGVVRSKLRDLVEKYGVPTAAAARKFAPITSYLSESFIGGKRDPEFDLRKRAVARINEIHEAAAAAPDAAFLAVEGVLGAAGDVAGKIHQQVVNAVNHLASVVPRDPGIDTKMFSSNWTPAWHEAIALAHRIEAVKDPITAIARSIGGDSHPATTETLWTVYPALMSELAQEVSVAAGTLKNLTYQQSSAYSNLFRTPMSALQEPVVVTTIQGLYLPKPQQQPSGGSNPTGRPAAIQSPVAGSNVNSLIS